MRGIGLAVCLAAAMGFVGEGRAEEGFVPLFDGKSLDGWQGDPELWSVEDGAIAGSSDVKTLPHNSFLATKRSYTNFVLKAAFKLRNHNSGIQVRSKQNPDYRVTGYQPDIAEKRYTGILYEEGGRGILADVKPAEVSAVLKAGDWNQYVITCDGPRITIELNGFKTVEYTEQSTEKGASAGVIAFQLHAGPKMKVWYKDVVIRELP